MENEWHHRVVVLDDDKEDMHSPIEAAPSLLALLGCCRNARGDILAA